MQIVLYISANTTKNNNAYLERMLNELKAVDSGKHEIVINIWEKHLKLEDSKGLDAGSWAITPEELAEIL